MSRAKIGNDFHCLMKMVLGLFLVLYSPVCGRQVAVNLAKSLFDHLAFRIEVEGFFKICQVEELSDARHFKANTIDINALYLP